MGKSKKLKKLMKAAKMGNPYAQYQLGMTYQLGRAVPMNLAMAAMWMQTAARADFLPAKEWLSDYSFDDDANVQSVS